MCDCVSMAAKRTNSSLDGWYTVKRKSSEKSSVELDCEAYSEDEVTEETVPAAYCKTRSSDVHTDFIPDNNVL